MTQQCYNYSAALSQKNDLLLISFNKFKFPLLEDSSAIVL